jgi:hypothetical protein
MRRLSGKAVSRGKASRRLDIHSKATVAAPRTQREGWRRRGGGDMVATARDPAAAARDPVAAARDPAAAARDPAAATRDPAVAVA